MLREKFSTQVLEFHLQGWQSLYKLLQPDPFSLRSRRELEQLSSCISAGPGKAKGTKGGNYHPTTSPKEAGGFPGAGDGKPSNLAWSHAGDYGEESNKTQLGLGILREEFHTTLDFCFKNSPRRSVRLPTSSRHKHPVSCSRRS